MGSKAAPGEDGPNWKQRAAFRMKGVLRRQADALLPRREIRQYEAWIRERRKTRASLYKRAPERGLLSILTPVWNGSPVRYLRLLAESIQKQNLDGASEWVLLDNGCVADSLLRLLGKLAEWPWVKLIRSEENLGITRGLEKCLHEASGRYVLPVDADDLLYGDALQVIASEMERVQYPALLYTDEDKTIGSRVYQPYFKPDWDPVLLLNSAYIAHLGVIDRKAAIELGAYSDAEAEGSPDWDLFLRFTAAGYSAHHIPEVVYSWRVHRTSTADDSASKPYIAASQRKALTRYFAGNAAQQEVEIEQSALFAGGVHWRISPKAKAEWSTIRVDPGQLIRSLPDVTHDSGFVLFLGRGVTIHNDDWQAEVSGLFARYPEAMVVGGRICGPDGRIASAEIAFNFDDFVGGPNRGRRADDPGYFGQMWKQRSVDATPTQLAAMRVEFLRELMEKLPPVASVGLLGLWAGAYAAQAGYRVIYTPFLSAVSDGSAQPPTSSEEIAQWKQWFGGSLPIGRYYPRHLSRRRPFEPERTA